MMFYESAFKIIPGVQLPVRSVLLQLSKGAVLISPIHFTPRQIDSIRALTPVTDMIAPNLSHSKFMQEASLKFPGATIWAPPGMKEKEPTLNIHKTLTEEFWPYHGELEFVMLEGAPRLNECVFFDVKSKTLIVADLAFNILRPIGLLAPLVFWKFGTYKRFGVSKFWLRFTKDRAALSRSLAKVLAWDFDRIVMAHGEVVVSTPELSAKERLRTSLLERGLVLDPPHPAGLLQAPKT